MILVGGLLVMLVANAWLVRISLRPLRRLSELMSIVDVLEPGRRLDPAADGRGRRGDLDLQLDARPPRGRAAVEHAPGAGRPGGRAAPDRAGAARPDRPEPHRGRPRAERVRGRIDAGEAEVLADAQELARESLEEVRGSATSSGRPRSTTSASRAPSRRSARGWSDARASPSSSRSRTACPARRPGRAGGLPHRAGGPHQRGPARAVRDRARLAEVPWRRRRAPGDG